MKRRVIILAAGAALTVSACKPKAAATPEEPEPEPIRTANPPAPTIPEADAEVDEGEPEGVELDRDPAKPMWDDVPSGHPKGATNPPIPELIVTPEGQCFKRWVSPMAMNPGGIGPKVLPCDPADHCGTPIQCPDKAAQVLADHASAPKKGGGPADDGEK